MNIEKDVYPTRGNQEMIIDRVDPIVYSSEATHGEYLFEKEQLDTYARAGFLLFPGLFDREEVEAMREEYQRLAKNTELRNREEFIFEPDSNEPRSIFNPQVFSPLYDRLSRDPRILNLVRQLLGGDVYIHHGRINIKRPYSGKSFPWHSDFETWHAEDGMPRMRAVTGWVMLTENNEFNGPLYLIPGSHKRFVGCKGYTPTDHHKASLRKQEYGVPSPAAVEKLVSDGGMAGAYGPAGTLVFHESNIMHGSPDNISPWPRTNVFFVYNSVENQPTAQPFAAATFRPVFLSNPDRRPLTPASELILE